MNTVKKEAAKDFSQFEITSDLLRNLYKFNLTPVTKLVLLELTTHLNEDRNGSVVFPSIGYIAEVLGIGLTAAKKAINDLIKEGIIIKSKRGNVRGNYNKYLLTPKVRNSTSERSENDCFKQSDSDLFLLRTNNNEHIKEQTVKIKGGNVYSEDDKILQEYAEQHKARNIKAYVNTLKSTGSAEKILKEHRKKSYIAQRAENSVKETQELITKYSNYAADAVSSETCAAWQELGKKLGIKK